MGSITIRGIIAIILLILVIKNYNDDEPFLLSLMSFLLGATVWSIITDIFNE